MNQLENLQEAETNADLARILDISEDELNRAVFFRNGSKKYTEFTIPKKSGGSRCILAPNGKLKRVQKTLSDLLLDCLDMLAGIDKKRIYDGNNALYENTLSHGFTRRKSIITNAAVHRKRNCVLNFDLENFFDSFHPGRIKGFFIKNKYFHLNPEVANTIARIACYDNKLPQGSPCSPVIANIIASVLDHRLNKLAKKEGCKYSRYADDITISTNKKKFSNAIVTELNGKAKLGDAILKEIEQCGFSVNSSKTRVEYRMARQTVTGLIVNEKVNTPKEYWRTVRAQVDHLVRTGVYNEDCNESDNLLRLQGKLNFINQANKHNYKQNKPEVGKNTDIPKFFVELSSREKSLSKFLYYKYFIGNERLQVLSEGKTDRQYIECAMDRLKPKFPNLNTSEPRSIHIKMFKNTASTKKFLDLADGSDNLKRFAQNYGELYRHFKCHQPKAPVVILLDNDEGAKGLLNWLVNQKPQELEIILSDTTTVIHVQYNVYVVIIPSLKKSKKSEKNKKNQKYEVGKTSIEDLLDDNEMKVLLGGKKLNKENRKCEPDEIGKATMAERVRKNKNKMSFNGFECILQEFININADYEKNKSQYVKGLGNFLQL